MKITTTEGEILHDEININIQSNIVLTTPEEPLEDEIEEKVEEELMEENPATHTQTPKLRITKDISQITVNNIESIAIGGELAWNIGKQWGVGFGTTTPHFGKVICKATSFSGGVFVSF